MSPCCKLCDTLKGTQKITIDDGRGRPLEFSYSDYLIVRRRVSGSGSPEVFFTGEQSENMVVRARALRSFKYSGSTSDFILLEVFNHFSGLNSSFIVPNGASVSAMLLHDLEQISISLASCEGKADAKFSFNGVLSSLHSPYVRYNYSVDMFNRNRHGVERKQFRSQFKKYRCSVNQNPLDYRALSDSHAKLVKELGNWKRMSNFELKEVDNRVTLKPCRSISKHVLDCFNSDVNLFTIRV